MWPFKKNRGKSDYLLWDLIPKIKPMDIIVVADFDWWNPVTWSSRWIRVKTASQYSHVLVAGINGYCYTTDLFFKKDRLLSYLMGKDHFKVVRFPGLTAGQIMDGLRASQGEVGKLYPFIDVLSMALQNTINPGAYRLKVDSKDKICSQFVAWVYRDIMKADLAPQLDKDISMFTPVDCLDDTRLINIGEWIS
jgi:hypothetical protein